MSFETGAGSPGSRLLPPRPPRPGPRRSPAVPPAVRGGRRAVPGCRTQPLRRTRGGRLRGLAGPRGASPGSDGRPASGRASKGGGHTIVAEDSAAGLGCRRGDQALPCPAQAGPPRRGGDMARLPMAGSGPGRRAPRIRVGAFSAICAILREGGSWAAPARTGGRCPRAGIPRDPCRWPSP